ncbi:nucleotide-diphospho-sugar transferase [Aspergillus violaceofuscus CBS 115571]|uniref:Nucleotide-diphospho-sugar transferase n=1 Tax=Aspergillus violaceofuscus (strain CBS 115571) TaxID=1450538 RepID=A0A2V5HRI2_ASPV1|nr:nucleotide-diphospho-sugar transferase [Aspergillus violaceofuscus CBS 115571]
MKQLLGISSLLVGILLLSSWWSSGILPWQRANHNQAASPTQRSIYAAYLSPPTEFEDFWFSRYKNSSDPYFDAVRILAYQILHASATRTRRNLDFVVFVHEGVDESKRDCLRRDGARVVELPELRADWTRFKDARWAHVLTRLRLWQMVQYDRILLLDADSVLTRSIDTVWDLPEIQPKAPLSTSVHVGERVLPLPKSYVLAGLPQLRLNHTARPTRVPEDFYDWETLNVGFLMLQPSLEIFDYFAAMLAVPESFESSIADQSLVNALFAADGPMPWTQLDLSWNVQWPWPEDTWAGYAVLHDKWWAPLHLETLDFFHSWYWRMIGFYSGRDG